jgi:hypothetical protein
MSDYAARKAEGHEAPVPGLREALAAFFPANIVQWKPQTVSGNRALAVGYIDARAVMDRLDAVLGIDGWQDDYEPLPDGNVVCRLRVRVAGEWLTKCDVGGESDQKDDGDRRKASFSDALKRAAVKLGVGRYLYDLPGQWCDYDPQKRQFVRQPVLPAAFLPTPPKAPPAPAAVAPTKPAPALPATGEDLVRRLKAKEAHLFDQKICGAGELVAHVLAEGTKAGWSANMREWPEPAIRLAAGLVKSFEAACRERADPHAVALLRKLAAEAGYDQKGFEAVALQEGAKSPGLLSKAQAESLKRFLEEEVRQQRAEADAIASEEKGQDK